MTAARDAHDAYVATLTDEQLRAGDDGHCGARWTRGWWVTWVPSGLRWPLMHGRPLESDTVR